MRSNGICAACSEDVRWIILEYGDGKQRKTPINPKPDPAGRLYIDRWEDSHPVLVMCPAAELVPTHVPIRYTLHDETCRGAA